MYEPSYFLPSETHFTERESRKSNALAYKAQQFSDDSRNLSVIIYLSILQCSFGLLQIYRQYFGPIT